MSDTLLLIDLSSLVYPLWHMSGKETDQDWTSHQAVARVRALAAAHPHAAVCCDSGRSFRHEVDPSYKANRPESIAPLQHQMTLTIEQLRADGFPCWAVKGFEADDLIASAAAQAVAMDGDVLIASADKDLLALVGPRVKVKSLTSGAVLDEAAVLEKFGVKPSQMLDFLCLVGDSSDNVKGAKGIGAKHAATLLATFGSIEAMYAALDAEQPDAFKNGIRNSLIEFRDRWPTVRQLIALRTDVEIPLHEIATERTVIPMTTEPEPVEPQTPTETSAPHDNGATLRQDDAPNTLHPPAAPLAVIDHPRQTDAAPVEWDRALEPRNMTEAVQLAQRMFESRLFSAYGTPQAVLATVLAGRELGLPAMASLRAFHVIEGKPVLSAGAIQSLVMRSGKAVYFRCTERTAERATFQTLRAGDNEEPVTLSFSVAEGRQAFPGDEKSWGKSGWGRNPADMCVARAASKLARLVYPDVVSGLYAPEEFDA